MLIYLCLGGAVLLAAADYFLKQLVVNLLKPIGSYPLWEGVLHFTYHENTGAAFSMLDDSTRLLVAVTSVALTVLVGYMLLKRPNSRWLCISLMLIIAGGLGNLIDRVVLGYVVDFIDFTLINFAVFNFADICAVIGTIMTMGYLLFVDGIKLRALAKHEAAQAAETAAGDADEPAQTSAETEQPHE